MLESMKKFLGGESVEKSSEEARIAELEKERRALEQSNVGRPESWGVDPRFEQINKEIENLRREMQEKK